MTDRLRLPLPGDHAFADGGAITVGDASAGRGGLVSRLVLALHDVLQREVARAVAARFASGAVLGEAVRVSPGARLVNRAAREKVRIGAHTIVRGVLRNEAGGELEIGEEVYIGDGTLISSAQRVAIGSQTLIAHGVQVFDNASHPIDAAERADHFRMMLGLAPKRPVTIPAAEVVVGRNCWLAANSILLAGARIGDRSIVSAGSVVRGEVPPDVIYSGHEGSATVRPLERR